MAAVVLQWLMGQSNIPVTQLYANGLDGNIVLLGNSRAYRIFPVAGLRKELGHPVVNLSYPGISTRISVAILEDYIDRYGPPRLVIAEISDVLESQESISVFRHYSSESKRLAAIVKDTYPDLYRAGQVSHLFNFNNPMFLNSLHKIFLPIPDPQLRGTVSADAVQDMLRDDKPDNFKILPENAQSLAALTALALQHGFELRLVITPFLRNLVSDKYYERWQRDLLSLAGNYQIWDYGLNPRFQSHHFHDRNHLNFLGVKVLFELFRHDGFFAQKQTYK